MLDIYWKGTLWYRGNRYVYEGNGTYGGEGIQEVWEGEMSVGVI